jgi:3-phosphoshikimate 1-carboxyvinyltransferase
LRVKECDRIACPQAEFVKIGLEFRTGKDWVEIAPVNPNELNRYAECLTYNDHRMAMSLAVLGSRLPRSFAIVNPSCVAKTFPHFWSQFELVWKSVEGLKRK